MTLSRGTVLAAGLTGSVWQLTTALTSAMPVVDSYVSPLGVAQESEGRTITAAPGGDGFFIILTPESDESPTQGELAYAAPNDAIEALLLRDIRTIKDQIDHHHAALASQGFDSSPTTHP